MKPFNLPTRSLRASRRGVALIIVLGLLVIILGLAVTFLNRASIERSASAGYAAASTTRQLADTVVNLVQGQIRDATTQGSNVAWASQPGMIRTFAGGSAGSYTAGGNLLRAYKLYSSDNMMVGSGNVTASDQPPGSWASDKGVWTDLNSPVTVSGNVNYPIVDPGAIGEVEGFTVTGAPTTGTTNPVPMPVRWLYVLKDGTLVAPTGSGNSATVAGANTSDKAIVGRVAFWTDDETAKVNINTASDGTFYDTPRAMGTEDSNFGIKQPVQNEYQRYPGHPAMTSLAPVLFAPSAEPTVPYTISDAQQQAIYEITPRVTFGGSKNGTVTASTSTSAKIPTDTDRLYASVDELVFGVQNGTRQMQSLLTKEKIERSRFFLTATSRAPEVTLFNTPRVSMWPIDANTAYQTAFDRLIAFCSTINDRPYYFTRANPKSSTADIAIQRNIDLYKYLQALTSRPFPGVGKDSFRAKYGDDRDQILTQMFDYIHCTNLDDVNLPVSSRFGAVPRATTNFRSPTRGFQDNTGQFQVLPLQIGPLQIDTVPTQTQGFGRSATITEAALWLICTADAATPASNTLANKTLNGVLLKPGEISIEAMLILEAFIPGSAYPGSWPNYAAVITGLENFSIGAKNLGFPKDATKPTRYFYYNGYLNTKTAGGIREYESDLQGCHLGARGSLPVDAKAWQDAGQYPFVGIPVTISSNSTAAFIGGNITVKLYPRTGATSYDDSAKPVLETTIKFPDTTFPLPRLYNTGNATADSRFWTFSRSGNGISTQGRLAVNPRIQTVDVVKSIVPSSPDYRLLAAGGNVTWEPHRDYRNEAVSLAHNLTYGTGGAPGFSYAGDGTGPNLSAYYQTDYTNGGKTLGFASIDVPPYASPSFTNLPSVTGDWDNGLGAFRDGPYINRADEGNTVGLPSNPYAGGNYAPLTAALFSPNRQIPSAGMFGSLPTGVKRGISFQTLLFRPQSGHPGEATASNAADHLWTDFFWMPVVEPYAISEPFSTAGKINMNYRIEPFGYIKRYTGIAALLFSEKVMEIPVGKVATYKDGAPGSLRLRIDTTKTIAQFEEKLYPPAGEPDVFRSASQICDIYLVPEGVDLASMPTRWNSPAAGLTGDNTRERPYANLLGRLTTKSNTFTVHYRVQSLRKAPAGSATEWDETKDKVTGEYRGSTTIERYINPNDSTIPDYASILAANASATPTDLGSFYKWRVLNTRQFAP